MDRTSDEDEPSLMSDDEFVAMLDKESVDDLKHLVADGQGVIHDVSSARRKKHPQPDPVMAVPVIDVASVNGRRVVHQKEDGPRYDLRAVSEVFTDSSGSWIKVVPEWRWYAWIATPKETRPTACPRATALPTLNVWVQQFPL